MFQSCKIYQQRLYVMGIISVGDRVLLLNALTSGDTV